MVKNELKILFKIFILLFFENIFVEIIFFWLRKNLYLIIKVDLKFY